MPVRWSRCSRSGAHSRRLRTHVLVPRSPARGMPKRQAVSRSLWPTYDVWREPRVRVLPPLLIRSPLALDRRMTDIKNTAEWRAALERERAELERMRALLAEYSTPRMRALSWWKRNHVYVVSALLFAFVLFSTFMAVWSAFAELERGETSGENWRAECAKHRPLADCLADQKRLRELEGAR